jgi:hypothetical protein
MNVAKPSSDARIACRICLIAAAVSVLPAVCTYAADLNWNLKSPSPVIVVQATPAKPAKKTPQASPVAPNSSGADAVNRMLANPESDPDVPLPRRDLATRPPNDGPSDHPTIWGRQEDGGGVFGLKVPIPADRNSSDRHTRSSGGGSPAD